MPASTTMTSRVPTEVKGQLEQLARETHRSKSFLAANAVSAYVEREMEIVEGIKRGLQDAEAGNLIDHDEVVAILEADFERIRAAKK